MNRQRSPYRDHDYSTAEDRHGGSRGHPSARPRWPEDSQGHRSRRQGYGDAIEAEERMRRAQADFDYRSAGGDRWDERLGGYRRDEHRIGDERYGPEYGPGWYDARDYRSASSGTTGDGYFAEPGWGSREQDFRERPGEHRGRGPAGYRRSDERIREDVSDGLTDDPYLDASGVQVTVNNCEVALDGNVDSRYAKRRAEVLCERVSGVAHVQNNLRVRGAEETKPAPLASSLSGKQAH